MNEIWSADGWLVFIAFFIPGFVSSTIYNLIVASDRVDFGKDLPRLVGYSVIHYAATLWIVIIAPAGPLKLASLYVVVLILPVLWPFVILVVRDPKRYRDSILTGRIVGLMAKPHVKPWDAVFDTFRSGGCWVRIRLTDGRYVGGIFGDNEATQMPSEVSSYPSEEQIYLAVEYEFDDDGYLKGSSPVPRSGGLLVNGNEIEHIRFFK